MLFTSVHILDSLHKCHYNVFMLQLLCVSNYWQWIWVRNVIALSLTFHYSPKVNCTLKHSIMTACYVSVVAKGHLESSIVFFGKRLDINLDKRV